MSLTLSLWLALFVILVLLSLRRPAWGVGLYMMTFFACPPYWWWGSAIEGYRWNLYGGIVLLAAILFSGTFGRAKSVGSDPPDVRRVIWFALAILVNATLVHMLLAPNMAISAEAYFLVAKFVLLFLMIVAAAKTEIDYRIVLLAIVLGAGYIGFEATINDRGNVSANRLNGIGAPGADGSNECASLMVAVLPIAGALFLVGGRKTKLLMLCVAPMILNVVLLCNSRAAFLGLIVAAAVFLVICPHEARKRALKLLAMGAIAVWLLLGDPRIMDRFFTAFEPAEQRDASAGNRLDYWGAGLTMISEHPFGAGGSGFKKVHGTKYLADVGHFYDQRAVHNGYINEACEWGVQGLALRLIFIGAAFFCLVRTVKRCRDEHRLDPALLGAGMAAGMAAFMVTCVFGDRLDAEWGYWLPALMIAHTRLYGTSTTVEETDELEETEEEWFEEEEYAELEAAGV